MLMVGWHEADFKSLVNDRQREVNGVECSSKTRNRSRESRLRVVSSDYSRG